MARLQIRMMDAPTHGIGAFMPPPYLVTTPAASSQGVLRTEGHPGTLRVPTPRPPALDDLQLGGPYNQPSDCSPNYMLPDKYISHISRATTGLVNRVSTNVAPVPAVAVTRSGAQTQMKVRIGGRTTTRWPRQFVRWPNYKETG